MNTPENLKYSKTHEWVRECEDGTVEIGITDFAQKEMGSIVFVNLPEEGDEVEVGQTFGDLESVKAVSDVYCPVSGTVAAINEDLLDNPGNLNEDPYGAWMIRVENVTEKEELLDAAAYDEVCKKEA